MRKRWKKIQKCPHCGKPCAPWSECAEAAVDKVLERFAIAVRKAVGSIKQKESVN